MRLAFSLLMRRWTGFEAFRLKVSGWVSGKRRKCECLRVFVMLVIEEVNFGSIRRERMVF